jgi:tetratricopeptide (TPR) repeat protein
VKSRATFLALLLLGPLAPAGAQEWYEHYLPARDRLIPAGQYAPALRELHAAIRLKPAPKLNERTYSMQFEDYMPYFYLGLCQLHMGDAHAAIVSFDTEERYGVIRERPVRYKELQLRRQEAQAQVEHAEQQRLLRVAQDRVEAQLERSGELERDRKYDDALELLTQAQKTAVALDPQIQRRIEERLVHIRGLKREAEDAEARARRIDKALADARQLMDESRDQDAVLKFDEVLTLDPKNAAAENGRREAQERLLAATTRQEREKALATGEALLQAGQYDEALPFLSRAAADPDNANARELLARAQQKVEGVRRQRERRHTIERLMAEGERCLAATPGRFAAAQVKFEEVLAIDPSDVHAQERRAFAERRAEEAAVEKQRPNLPPKLVVLEPAPTNLETEADTVSVEGVATDDRGLARIEFFVAGHRVAEQEIPPKIDSSEPQREKAFTRPFALSAGPNEIRIRVTDVEGLTHETTFVVSRRLRLYERPAIRLAALASVLGLLGLALAANRLRRARARKRRFNPYVAGAPVVDDHLFFGRQEILTRVLSLLHHNSFMITGERRIGKTSFLLRLKRALETEDGPAFKFFPVLVDLQGVAEESFFHAIMNDAMDALALPTATLAMLRYSPTRPQYDGRDFSHDLQLVLAELATRTTRSVRLVLMLDEIDVLNEYSERTNQLLRSIFMKTFSEHLVAVMCGVGVKRTWSSDASPWYNFFEQLRLTPFSRADAEALIRTPVAGVFRYEAQAVENILEYSGMKPYLIQKFCIQAINRILEQRRSTIGALDVESVRPQVLADADNLPQAVAAHEVPA